MLDGNTAGAEDALQAGRVEEDEDDDEGEEDGGEEVEVLRGLVEGGRVLEDAEVAGARGEEVEPLPGGWRRRDRVSARRQVQEGDKAGA